MPSDKAGDDNVEVLDQDAPEVEHDRSSDGISVEIDTVAGPISIVRTTQTAHAMMQHC
jgi:hypothetical protein